MPASRHADCTPPTPVIARAEPKAHGAYRFRSSDDRIELRQPRKPCLMPPFSPLPADQAEVSIRYLV